MTYRFLYVTAGSADEATRIARALVEERLVACANVLPHVTSLYWWDGAVQESSEAVLVAKTREERVEAVIARVNALHSYSCPCIVALPILEGNPAYLAWIGAEVAERA